MSEEECSYKRYTQDSHVYRALCVLYHYSYVLIVHYVIWLSRDFCCAFFGYTVLLISIVTIYCNPSFNCYGIGFSWQILIFTSLLRF